MGIFLNVANVLSLPQGWSIYAIYTFIVANQVYNERFKKADLEHKFDDVYGCGWGYVSPVGTQALVLKDDDATKFKDLGLLEKALVPLLEEPCLWHPSLMDCKQKRSCKFTEWALTTLGRVLQFLKNKKWKDMNEKACEELQHLWEELEMSRLYLRWLEPLVKYALNKRGYAKKVEKLNKLK
ncbi:uncharacterized protein LOC129302642 [Prosopis cineraria]|uniref:uncharacterized protein LOC129302642 n=1 Tax=Prosopis cineraria TaxID=364024 RepID=UPI002410468D|nr:uncharacterized protein LOC129302642 [Prosopis cineraria]